MISLKRYQLVFATANAHKIREINEILMMTPVSVVSMADIGCTDEIPETQPTIQGNAIQKATYLHEKYQINCFSEDSGLEIDALNGEPGVDSAFYSGSRNAQQNINLVLNKLGRKRKRTARFRTVIALILEGKQHLFEGVCEGTIRFKPSGSNGFGYDPIFQPNGFDKTFAELPAEIKNQISHRAKAVQQLYDFLQSL
jgi:XTP/dITP diphosphohydrolase